MTKPVSSRTPRRAQPARAGVKLRTGQTRPAACACGAVAPVDDQGGRRAVAVDPDVKARNRARLRRIEGQVRGLQQMVDDERYCADVLVQLSAVQEALRAVARELVRNHLKHCAAAAFRGPPEAAEAMLDELAALVHRHAR